MTAAVILPVRAFVGGKSRLRALTVDQRARLLRASAESVVRAAAELPVAVVSGAPEVRDWAGALGLVLLDDPGSLDEAASAGLQWGRRLGASRVVVVHADLPWARSLIPLVRDGGRAVAAAVPCRRDDGTPAVSVPTCCEEFRFRYGPGSFRRHAAEARRLELGFRVVRAPDLTCDIDFADDLVCYPRSARQINSAPMMRKPHNTRNAATLTGVEA